MTDYYGEVTYLRHKLFFDSQHTLSAHTQLDW